MALARRNRVDILLHFVWTTWDRKPLLTEEIIERVYAYIITVCEDDGCKVLAIGGIEDHVHLLVSFPTTQRCADLMQHAKGGSSHFVKHELRPGEWFEWQQGYGVFSVSRTDRDRVIAYIRNQKQRHASGKLWDNAEQSFEIYVPA